MTAFRSFGGETVAGGISHEQGCALLWHTLLYEVPRDGIGVVDPNGLSFFVAFAMKTQGYFGLHSARQMQFQLHRVHSNYSML